MTEVLSITRRDGYELRLERHTLNFSAEVLHDGDSADVALVAEHVNNSKGEVIEIEIAYTPEGHHIGDEETAKFLIAKHGIAPVIRIGKKTCSIGFCEREQKWYGWSHRAIFGFGVGDSVKEGDCTNSSGWTEEYLAEHPDEDLSLPVGFEAKTLDDAKRMAIAFAESVS